MKVSVRPVEKQFGIFIDEHLLGTTKLECDALLHLYKLKGSESELRQMINELLPDEIKIVTTYVQNVLRVRPKISHTSVPDATGNDHEL